MNKIETFTEFINEAKKFLETRESAGLAIVHNGMVLLGHSTGRKKLASYGISKGGIDEGESILDAAIRETREEFGIKVPKALVGGDQYTFTVTSRKYKYNKVVYYFIVEVDDLSKIGLKDIEVPKGQLQLAEVDHARFMNREDAVKHIMISQFSLLQNLTNKGLI